VDLKELAKEGFSTVVKNSLLVKPLSGKRAFEEIADQIRDLIYTKKLKPGEKLPAERDLAEMFNAGRTAVRESLRILEHSGLITVKQGSDGGSFVKEVNSSAVSKSFIDVICRREVSVEDFIEVRIGVEKLAIGSAMARITPEELDLLRKCVEDAEAMLKEAEREGRFPDLDSWVRANGEFHLILFRATGNPFFEMIEEALLTVTSSFLDDPPLIPENFVGHVQQHREIYEAVKNKDLRLAERLLEAHSAWIAKTLSAQFTARVTDK
jgi:GntR family transcriptional repressor for pyruvate dehydrogenase complex